VVTGLEDSHLAVIIAVGALMSNPRCLTGGVTSGGTVVGAVPGCTETAMVISTRGSSLPGRTCSRWRRWCRWAGGWATGSGGGKVLMINAVEAGCIKAAPAPCVARAGQGAGAALMQPASTALIINTFGPSERGRASAIAISVSTVFTAAGPLVGGALTELVSWRAVLLASVPIAVAAWP
jgi:MFS family permease